jgi:outer membrane receptor protein involved in Fe transport
MLVALPSVGFAEDEPIDEIAVTATPRATNSRDISAALSLVSQTAIDASTLLTDALQDSVGVTVQRTTPGQGAAIIRGLKGSSVLHLVDGMRLNNAIFRSAPTQYLSLVPTTAVDRIEIIRGAPAGHYGSDAVGGVVHVIPRKPTFDSSETEIQGNVGVAFDSADLAQSIGGSVDIGNRELVSSISAEYTTTGNRRTGAGRLTTGGYSSRAVRAYFSAMPGDTKTWSLDLHWLEQPSTPRVDELIPGFGQLQPSSSEYYFEPNARWFAHAHHADKDGPLGLEWNYDLAWQRIADDRRIREFGADARTLEKNRSDLYGASIAASGDSSKTVWTIGAELYYDEVRSARANVDLVTNAQQSIQPRFPDDSSISQAALFANFTYTVNSSNELNGGLGFSAFNVRLPESIDANSASIDTRRWSGNIGWIFSATESWQLVSNFGFGFRAPNIFDLGTLGSRAGNRFNIPSTDLGPETVVHGDIGVRYWSERSRFELVAFALDYDDRITSVSTGEITDDGRDVVQSLNATSATIHGVELGLQASLGKALIVHATAGYTWGQQRLAGDPHEPADRIPPLSGRIGFTAERGSNWTFDGWIRWAGAQDRLSSRDGRDVRIDPSGTPGWASVGAQATWENDSTWRATFSLSNILDKRYRVHGSGLDEPGLNASIRLHRSW